MRHSPESLFPIADDAMLADSMRRAQDGDRGAYEIVLRHCRDAFVRLAGDRYTMGSDSEVVCECLLALHRARQTFDPNRSFSAWVAAIARHHGLGTDPVDARRMAPAWIRPLFRGSRSRPAEGGAA